jgi:hypothetical protein
VRHKVHLSPAFAQRAGDLLDFGVVVQVALQREGVGQLLRQRVDLLLEAVVLVGNRQLCAVRRAALGDFPRQTVLVRHPEDDALLPCQHRETSCRLKDTRYDWTNR